MHDFDGFIIKVVEEDGEFVAYFADLPNVSAFAASPVEAIKELKIAWELIKESYVERGEAVPVAPQCKEYSGQFNVRVDKRLHRQLAAEASEFGISLNALVSQKLLSSTSDALHHRSSYL